MKIKNKFKKIKLILITTGLAILSSLLFSYIKASLSIGTGNVANVNQKIEINLLYVLIPVLVAPVIEEFIFRKVLPFGLEKLLERINRTTAIIIANGIFAAVHFDWFFFPYFVNGCLYAWSYEKTKDLKVPMLAHISYNAFVFLATSFLVD
ncbi:CPBP family intramembrane glutamic endopeptidase [Bacillus thuringiensis]|uniref:CPBP family intramembrane metalloprotease n=1 Tax=Bacillus thuringiensis TaxID=1428 RepID=A0A9X6V7N6_BACTU|nr:CPBP family intramembrane glutamic endopeptidase [Bacillus thuringiensis]MCU5282994.1 CPBP family intramembrane metalloprotease [Bacillus cereus]KIP28380.1 CAAX protease self-immunity family protein [Bacillus thuringiensis serovar morrisoni]MBG9638232.1 protease [Bacillus thuringiensis]MBG9674452.1 protease [Bacillus thuringiensis]MCT6946501.1 CPBP family intramembrane metalloprotease [Bacillus thuringiensis]